MAKSHKEYFKKQQQQKQLHELLGLFQKRKDLEKISERS